MSDCLKSGLISLGIGMAAGAYIATNNKKIQNFVKDTQSMIEEKLDSFKQSSTKIKEDVLSDNNMSFDENQKEDNKKLNKRKN